MKDKTIRLNHAKKIFPEKHTKVRREDLVSLAVDKEEYLTEREKRALTNTAGEIDEGRHHEFMATRVGQTIKLRAID